METIFYLNEKLEIKISGELLNTLKGTATTLPAVILYYCTLSGKNRQILTPNRYDEHPRHFYRVVTPGYFFVKLLEKGFLYLGNLLSNF